MIFCCCRLSQSTSLYWFHKHFLFLDSQFFTVIDSSNREDVIIQLSSAVFIKATVPPALKWECVLQKTALFNSSCSSFYAPVHFSTDKMRSLFSTASWCQWYELAWYIMTAWDEWKSSKNWFSCQSRLWCQTGTQAHWNSWMWFNFHRCAQRKVSAAESASLVLFPFT